LLAVAFVRPSMVDTIMTFEPNIVHGGTCEVKQIGCRFLSDIIDGEVLVARQSMVDVGKAVGVPIGT